MFTETWADFENTYPFYLKYTPFNKVSFISYIANIGTWVVVLLVSWSSLASKAGSSIHTLIHPPVEKSHRKLGCWPER